MQPGNVSVATAAVGLAPDLKKRIEIMAEHVARNGHDFEQSVKQKNAGSPQFGFLFSGEGAEYYAQLLQVHRAGAAPAGQPSPGNGAGGSAAEVPTNGNALASVLQRWREPPVLPVGPEVDRQIGDIVASLEHMASRDAVRAGRTWIEANAAIAHPIAGNLMKRLLFLPKCAHRLHVLFLLHDVLQSEVSRQDHSRQLVTAFKPYLVWMLRPSYQLAMSVVPSSEESQKILKLLQLWGERGILSAAELEDVRTIVTAKDLPPPQPGAAPPLQGLVQQMSSATALTATQVVRPPNAAVQMGLLQQQQQAVAKPGGVVPSLTAAALGLPPGFTGVRPPLPAMLPGRGGHTPESVPVGVMAAMLKQVSKRGKDLHTAFVPYKPLDPLYTPQSLPPVAPPNARLLERLAEFYEIVGDAAREPAKEEAAAAQPPAAASAGVGESRLGGVREARASRSRSRSPAAGRGTRSGGRDPADGAEASGPPAAAAPPDAPRQGSFAAVPPPVD